MSSDVAEQPVPPGPAAPDSGRHRPVPTRRSAARVWAAAGCLALACLVVVLHVRAYITLSPIDELQHIDSTIKAGQLDVVRQGERVSEPALREQSCRGIDSPGFVSPPCDAPRLRPEDYQEAGYNTAAGNPPTYYLVTGLAARAVAATGVVDSPVTAARLLGALWLAAGLLATTALARSLGASWRGTAAAVALLAATPVVSLPSATVSPDATSLLAGAIVALATVLHVRGQLPALALAPAAAVAVSPKATGILAVAVCGLLLIVHARGWTPSAWRPGRRGWLRALALLAAGGAAPVLLWAFVTRLRALDVPPSPMSRFDTDSLDAEQLLGNALVLLPPTQSPYLVADLRLPLTAALVGLTGYLLIACLAHAGLARRDRPAAALGAATLIGMLLGGPLLVVLVFLTAGAYFPLPPRYGLVLLPAAFAVLAVVASRHRCALAVTGGLATLQLALHVMALT